MKAKSRAFHCGLCGGVVWCGVLALLDANVALLIPFTSFNH